MKIAITAQENTLTSLVDPRFGRARYFIVADTETGEWQAVDNTQNLNAAQGAGVQAGANVAELGVEAVLTGHCGPRAFQTLAAAGVKICNNVDGTVEQAIERFKAGDLPFTDAADVAQHWA